MKTFSQIQFIPGFKTITTAIRRLERTALQRSEGIAMIHFPGSTGNMHAKKEYSLTRHIEMHVRLPLSRQFFIFPSKPQTPYVSETSTSP